MMEAILTTYQGAILGPIAKLLGYILEAIYYVLSMIHIENTGVCIILFTFLVNGLMLPLQIKQQKFSKMSSIMSPELTAIQNKYKNKKDQASQQKMSMETQAVYQKYGVSPASGCLPLLISMPILFALYRVIYNIPAYVDQVYDIYAGLADKLIDADVTMKVLSEMVKTKTYVVTDAVKFAKENGIKTDYVVDILGQFNSDSWKELMTKFPQLTDEIKMVSKDAAGINSFLGMNIADAPVIPFIGGNPLKLSVIIPVLSVITQIISTKLSMANTNQSQMEENPAANSMKTMNTVMPFFSGAMCFMFPVGVGIYWVAGNVFRIFQAIGINIHFSRIDMEAEVQKNIEKSKKRFEKMGIDPNAALNDLKRKETAKKAEEKAKTKASNVTKTTTKNDYKRANNTKYKEGSIAAYANMMNRNANADAAKKDEKK